MDEWYLIRSDDHDMDKDLVITAEVLDAVMDMASVMAVAAAAAALRPWRCLQRHCD